MMGTQAAPERLFYDFCLEDHVPDDHLLRRIDGVLDLGDIRQKLKPFYWTIGRPSIDPELMIRMLIVGYCLAIRSGPLVPGAQEGGRHQAQTPSPPCRCSRAPIGNLAPGAWPTAAGQRILVADNV